MKPVAALIPIKDHSERVSGKNFRVIAGRPLWEHVVATLSSLDEVGAIYIDTDSPRLTADVLSPFPKVRIIPRPGNLCGDFVPTNHLFAHDLSVIPAEFDTFLQTHTTNPLLTTETIRRCLADFDRARGDGDADSLFTATAYFARFFWRDGRPVNHNPKHLLRTQDLEPLLEENSNLYVFTRSSFAATQARIGLRPRIFEMDRLEATDIDDAASWRLAEALLAMRDAN